jgi:hypothetical protein
MTSMYEKELKLHATKKNLNFKAKKKRNKQDKKRPAVQQSNPNKRATADGQRNGGTKQCLKHPSHKHLGTSASKIPRAPTTSPRRKKSSKPTKKPMDVPNAKINDKVSSDSLFSNE